MDRIRTSADLLAHMNATESLTSGKLGDVQNAVGKLMSEWPNERGVFVQLQRLSDFITKTRQELSNLRPDQMKQEFIPKATDELDAIVEATASATHRIMDAADVIMEIAGRLEKEDSDKAMAAATSIFEACTFQDITGQRVTKVVNMFKVIEQRIDKMMAALGEGDQPENVLAAPADSEIVSASQNDIDAMFAAEISKADPQRSSLEGPALPGRGSTQAEVDEILSGKG